MTKSTSESTFPLPEYTGPGVRADTSRKKALVNLVKAKMTEYGWTITSLAEATGTQRTCISKFLAGKSMLAGDRLITVLEILGLRLVEDEKLAQKHCANWNSGENDSRLVDEDGYRHAMRKDD